MGKRDNKKLQKEEDNGKMEKTSPHLVGGHFKSLEKRKFLQPLLYECKRKRVRIQADELRDWNSHFTGLRNDSKAIF